MNPNPQAVFCPWLHMHQPPIWVGEGENARWMGNLEKMLHSEPNSEEAWNAQWFALAYKNPARYIQKLCEEGHSPRILVDYSGVLLEELALLSTNGTLNHLKVEGEEIGNVIELFRYVLAAYPEAIEFAGTAYSHCYFPATPEQDHEAQIKAWRDLYGNLFGEAALKRIRGFWLPEMGMMGDPGMALRFIRLLKKYGYEWIILPHSSLEHPEGWSNPMLENRVHWLKVSSGGESEEILCVVRDTDMGIRQQSGQNAEGCINGSRDRASALQSAGISTPALVIPTSDGENGNVMMFEYFPNSFAPLFYNANQWQDVAFMTVSEYIDIYDQQNPATEVTLNLTGGSWIGGHDSWFSGDERVKVMGEIETLSQNFANLQTTNSDIDLETAQKALLLCQTSCFVYWNSPFWFDQAKQSLTWARKVMGIIEVGESQEEIQQTLPKTLSQPRSKIKIEHRKLVRDRIPEIIRSAGNDCEVTTLSETEYKTALQQKLLEEVQEVISARNSSQLIQELADLYEVLETILATSDINPETLKQVQKQKREERGGFEKRLKLQWTTTE